MKITLALDIYNKEQWIESLLDSWVSNLSGANEYEIIIVFDDCRDRSAEIAESYLKRWPYKRKLLFADNKFEIFCNNLALKHVSGDYTGFIQDDNWMYESNWDLLLRHIIQRVPNVGAIGFLGALKILLSEIDAPLPDDPIALFLHIIKQVVREVLFLSQVQLGKPMIGKPVRYEEIEIDHPQKGEYFSMHKVQPYELGVWQVHAINRLYCVSRPLLLSKGELDKEFMLMDGDGLDLSLK